MNRLIKKILKNKKRLYIVCCMVFAVGLLVCGSSLAYFTNRDSVTNVHNSHSASIRILEPKWESDGKAKAMQMQPGMTIEKDPQVLNTSSSDIYIRLKIIVQYINDNGDYTAININDSRYWAIIDALYCENESGDVKLFEDNKSNNEAYVYDDGWFYYVDSDGYKILSSSECSEPLFDKILIPVLRDEYDGIFDKDFQIKVSVQYINASLYQQDDTQSIIEVFEKYN